MAIQNDQYTNPYATYNTTTGSGQRVAGSSFCGRHFKAIVIILIVCLILGIDFKTFEGFRRVFLPIFFLKSLKAVLAVGIVIGIMNAKEPDPMPESTQIPDVCRGNPCHNDGHCRYGEDLQDSFNYSDRDSRYSRCWIKLLRVV